jgi:OmpA-OmpF porin, OOP family
MNKKSICLAILMSLLWVLPAKSQSQYSTTSKKAIGLFLDADNFRVKGEYDKAIDLLNQALSKDKNFEEAYFHLGLIYRAKQELTQSTNYLEEGLPLAKDGKHRREYLYELGDNYLRLGKYEESKTKIGLFLNEEKINSTKIGRASVWLQQAEYGIKYRGEKLDYVYTPLNDSVNSYPNQYFPVLTADNSQLFFTIRYGSGVNENEDIVFTSKNNRGGWRKPASVSDNINSNLQEGACSISADGRQLIFTMCGGITYGRCDLFESKRVGNDWTRPVNLGPLVNGSEWEGQPSLSADGRVLYFSSSRKGGLGGYDLWMTKKDEAGKWTKAQNLGNSVNTKFDEISPFMHVNGQTLYFSSNGYPGYGGYDIYQTERSKNGWTLPMNLGSHLNDFEDQFSFFVTSDGTEAYFSKADVHNHGLSKIYTTSIPKEKQLAKNSFSVKGIVTDTETSKPVKATIELSNQKEREKVALVESDSINGSYLFVLNKGANYSLFVSAKGYLFKTYNFEIDSTKAVKPITLNIELKPIRQRASALLNNIFFDYDKYEIKAESYPELANVVKFLVDNPALVIEVAGHTDNKGSEEYNFKLSQKRAQSVIDFLATKGVDKARMSAKGYGASKPLMDNNSETNRQKNRRIEFVIVR